MKVYLVFPAGLCAILFCFLNQADGTLMLGTMMLAAKTGLMLGKMGVGGMMMMLLAASQQDSGTGYGKKRSIRSAGDDKTDKITENSATLSVGDKAKKVNNLATPEEILLTERMVRQIDSTFDSLTCIPKFVCGMNAQPPSKKTSLMNDYGHLLKIMFESDDDDSEEEGNSKSKGKQGLVMKDGDQIEDMVNDELMEEDPGLLPFVLKDVMNRHKDLHKDVQYDDYPENPMPFYPRPPPKQSAFSSLSSYLPKIEAGLGTKVEDSDFDSDPFFSGFRSLKALSQNETKGEHKRIPILDIDEDSSDVIISKAERLKFVRRKAKELEMSKDALNKYRIAAEVGRKLKNQKDCSKVFKKCPYQWEEVTGVVSNLRKVITSHPIITGKQPEKEQKVVILKTSTGTGANQSLLSIASAGANEDGTMVLHDLGNGTLMEISMKVVPMVDVVTNPVVEDLPLEITRPNKTRPTYPTDTKFPVRNPPKLTSDESLETLVSKLTSEVFQYQNKSSLKAKRRPRPSGSSVLPVLSEELATLPPKPVGEDDEFDDTFPVLVTANKNKKKIPATKNKNPPKKDKDDEIEVQEEDEEVDDDDDDADDEDEEGDDDDYEEYDHGRKASSAQLIRRKSPFFRIAPFPILKQRIGYSFGLPPPILKSEEASRSDSGKKSGEAINSDSHEKSNEKFGQTQDFAEPRVIAV